MGCEMPAPLVQTFDVGIDVKPFVIFMPKVVLVGRR